MGSLCICVTTVVSRFRFLINCLQQGEPPFCMDEAASHLEKLANNQIPRTPCLSVGYCILAPGPVVGPGVPGISARGQCLNPAALIQFNLSIS